MCVFCVLEDLCIHLLSCNLALEDTLQMQKKKYMTLYDYNNIMSNPILFYNSLLDTRI